MVVAVTDPASPGADGSGELEELLTAHRERLRRMLMRILGDAEDVADVLQETWVRIWQARDRLDASRDPWPFLRKTAVHLAMDTLRRRRSRPVRSGLEDERTEAPRVDRGPAWILAELEPMERACLTLFFWERCSVREIAEQLSVPVGTVKSWMFRGRARLREQLEEDRR